MKNNIEIDRYFKRECRCLAELLEITPAHYRNAELINAEFPISPFNVLFQDNRCNTLYDLLHFSPYEILDIEGVGECSLKKIVKWIIDYCKNDENKISGSIRSPDFKTGRMFMILDSMLNKEDLPRFIISKEETEYINRFKAAAEVLPYDLLYELLSNASELIDIEDVLLNFYDKEQYIQRLNIILGDMQDYVSSKPIYHFFRIYSDTFNDKCSFLLRLPKKTIINELSDKLTDKELSDFKILYSVYCFYKWLNTVDIEKITEEIFISSKINERQHDILQKRADGTTFETICHQYNITKERVRQIEMKATALIKHNKAAAPYYFIRLIYIINNRHNLAYADLEHFIDEEHLKILWYIICKGKFDCEFFYYEKDNNVLVFDDDKT